MPLSAQIIVDASMYLMESEFKWAEQPGILSRKCGFRVPEMPLRVIKRLQDTQAVIEDPFRMLSDVDQFGNGGKKAVRVRVAHEKSLTAKLSVQMGVQHKLRLFATKTQKAYIDHNVPRYLQAPGIWGLLLDANYGPLFATAIIRTVRPDLVNDIAFALGPAAPVTFHSTTAAIVEALGCGQPISGLLHGIQAKGHDGSITVAELRAGWYHPRFGLERVSAFVLALSKEVAPVTVDTYKRVAKPLFDHLWATHVAVRSHNIGIESYFSAWEEYSDIANLNEEARRDRLKFLFNTVKPERAEERERVSANLDEGVAIPKFSTTIAWLESAAKNATARFTHHSDEHWQTSRRTAIFTETEDGELTRKKRTVSERNTQAITADRWEAERVEKAAKSSGRRALTLDEKMARQGGVANVAAKGARMCSTCGVAGHNSRSTDCKGKCLRCGVAGTTKKPHRCPVAVPDGDVEMDDGAAAGAGGGMANTPV